MLRTSTEHLLWERQHLARYAEKGGSARGRLHPDPEHLYRTPFERDRDRIIHSRAFRRLESKTQVFVNRSGQSYRTRLTHTLEVAQVSRTVAHALRLNEDLTEAIALAHDLGHPPFGHAGERVLNVLAEDVGGFDHNRQSLRIADVLERRYASFPGLNLTWEVREGLGKHGSGRVAMAGMFGELPQPSLEAQVVDICDEIAYNNHDIDDGLTSGLLSLDQVLEELPLWRAVWEESEAVASNVPDSLRIGEAVRTLIDRQTTDLMVATMERLIRYKIEKPDEARARSKPLADFSPKMGELHRQQRAFLYASLYRHPEVLAANATAAEALRDLFEAYRNDRLPLPSPLNPEEAAEPRDRRIVDEIAGMTDDQAMMLHSNL